MSGKVAVDKLKALIKINTRINNNYSDTNTVLISILESAMCLVECESSSVLLLDEEDGTLHFVVALGPKGAEAKDIPVEKNSIAGWVVQNRQSVIINDASRDFRFNSSVQEKTNYITRNMIAFPMRVNGECIGVIELINKADSRNFNQEDLAILELLGNMAGSSYQNSHYYKSTKDKINVLQDSVNQGKDFHTFVAKSTIILDTLKVIEEAATTNSSVLIIGESGVGKELFAEQLHLKSRRRDKPFVRVSCAALSPSLLESELFGHVKGAFTNAVSSQKGRFEMADGGTLFLDEIGEMPLNLQAKLLRAIQERKFERVGSSETISVDVRIIAATNRDLEDMVRKKTFRDDLYYRLNVLPLNIPPLRRRIEDIQPLAEFFLEKYGTETKKSFEGFSSQALHTLFTYQWPGNVRELENTIERACILGKPPYIQVEDLHLTVASDSNQTNSENLLEGQTRTTASSVIGSEDKSLKNALNVFKKEYVTRILEETNWNQTAAAKVLGIQRTYVSKLLTELNIKRGPA